MSRHVFADRTTRAHLWHLIDARGLVVGKLAAAITPLLIGKHKPIYNPSVDVGDFVVVLNARHSVFLGKKWEKKLYRWHTGYVGHLKEETAAKVREEHPERIIEKAVWGMLPNNRHRNTRMKRLKVFPDNVHLYEDKLKAFRSPITADLAFAEHRETPVVWSKEDFYANIALDELNRVNVFTRTLTDEDLQFLDQETLPEKTPKQRH
eukprot:TRINITY_DN2328_c0_g1_i1.p1 TRINITY_DN2328_c0_g1~~TRINITY_DN2328_c0_g1_i1.p1  ORF type:complete len:207 (+),score=41.49 TRINITY_DN2328_c0_g1_i1:8-628(+)